MVTMMVITVSGDLVPIRCVHVERGHFLVGCSRSANHRDSRKRLKRKAQCKQKNEKEFAPGVHSAKV
jgi:hypothetical protein